MQLYQLCPLPTAHVCYNTIHSYRWAILEATIGIGAVWRGPGQDVFLLKAKQHQAEQQSYNYRNKEGGQYFIRLDALRGMGGLVNHSPTLPIV